MSRIFLRNKLFLSLLVIVSHFNPLFAFGITNSTRNDLFDPDDLFLNDEGFSESRKSETSRDSKFKGLPELCDMSLSEDNDGLSCKHFRDIEPVLEQMTRGASFLEITDSHIPVLNLSAFLPFPALRNISVTHSNVTDFVGRLPENVRLVNFSWNKINASSIGNLFGGRDDGKTAEFKVEIIDLSHNWEDEVVELPKSLFTLPSLKSLYLAGNRLEGHFVWSTIWEWANDSSIIWKDSDDALCEFPKHHKVFSLSGCLTAKTDFERTCGKLDKTKCSSCTLYGLQKDVEKEFPKYPISHKGKQGSTAISLTLNCSHKGLTKFPILPIQTWEVNVSHNLIKDLSPLKHSPYVLFLDSTNNSVDIETLIGTPFLEDFMSLSLQGNNIRRIPAAFLEAVRNVQNRKNFLGDVLLGDNYLHCDCKTATETKSLLNSMKNPDWKEIFCGNIRTPSGEYLAFKDLKIVDVCKLHKETNADYQFWIYTIIGVEIFFIVFIIGKVWYDQRTFRRTRKLPWCSRKMPRLPCDAILEGAERKDRRVSNATAIGNSYSANPSQISVHRSNSNVGNRSNATASRSNLRVPLVQFSVYNFKRTSRSDSDASHAASHHSNESSRSLIE